MLQKINFRNHLHGIYDVHVHIFYIVKKRPTEYPVLQSINTMNAYMIITKGTMIGIGIGYLL